MQLMMEAVKGETYYLAYPHESYNQRQHINSTTRNLSDHKDEPGRPSSQSTQTVSLAFTFGLLPPYSGPAAAAAGWPPSASLHLAAGPTAASAVYATAASGGGAAVAP